MTRLTKGLREAILVKASSIAFAARTRDLQLELSDLTYALYVHEYGANEQRARELGPEWVLFDSSFTVDSRTVNGEREDIPLTERAERAGKDWPFPRTIEHSSFKLEGDHPFAKRFKALYKKREKLAEDTDAFESKIKSVLRSVTTVEKLRDRWPECDRVLPVGYEPPPKYEIVPVSLINDINEALGIPVTETPISKAMAK